MANLQWTMTKANLLLLTFLLLTLLLSCLLLLSSFTESPKSQGPSLDNYLFAIGNIYAFVFGFTYANALQCVIIARELRG